MMIPLPRFQIVTLLKAGVKAVIYCGIRVKDQCPVIIKGLRPEQCTPNNIEQLKHEYAIAGRLNTAVAVKAYALEMHQGIPYLIMEDFQARSLVFGVTFPDTNEEVPRRILPSAIATTTDDL
ncbi:MAG: hypothetical protein V7K32_27615 [Nostoc sp.]|uniref:hypothetical protein n=1 Tax=Nostoc sp. TaxID=1180 RepID=UPI002FFA7251